MISFRGLETSIILDCAKILIIGPRGCGKTTLIKNLLDLKRENVEDGLIFNESGSEEEYRYYSKAHIYDKYSKEDTDKFIKEQKLFQQNRYLVLDDVNTEVLDSEELLSIFNYSKNWYIFYVQSFQYPLNLNPIYSCNTDLVFLFNPLNNDIKTKKIMWENYASIIPTFEIFCSLMDELHSYESLVIKNTSTSSDWKDFISWYKAV